MFELVFGADSTRPFLSGDRLIVYLGMYINLGINEFLCNP